MEVAIATLEANYKNLDEKLDDFIEQTTQSQKEIAKKLDLILEQTTRHNGRMSKMEEWQVKEATPLLKDYEEKRAEARGAIKLWLVIGAGVLTILIFAFNAYINDKMQQVTNEAADQVVQRIEATYTVKIQ